MLRNEYRRKPQGLADLLLPFALIEDGILLQYDGSLMAGFAPGVLTALGIGAAVV